MNPGPATGERVLVAMSGGVDSAVAAALLRERGCDVVGVTMRLWDGKPEASGASCCTPDDAADARRVAATLGIPHFVVDYRDAFRETVVDPFVAAYRAGRTPNPCVLCNDVIKFDRLLAFADKIGAPWLATGHYARVDRDGRELALRRGADPARDQSYFLGGIGSEALRRVVFPIGDLEKEAVRDHAARCGLRVAAKPDSQDVCFVGSARVRDFLASEGGAGEPGDFVSPSGEKLGEHDGVHAFTVGQRRGTGVAKGAALHVARIDPARRLVVLAPREMLDVTEIVIGRFSVLRPPRAGEALGLQVRHRGRAVAVDTITPSSTGQRVRLREPTFAPSPGQAAVLYAGAFGDEVIAAGTVEAEA